MKGTLVHGGELADCAQRRYRRVLAEEKYGIRGPTWPGEVGGRRRMYEIERGMQ